MSKAKKHGIKITVLFNIDDKVKYFEADLESNDSGEEENRPESDDQYSDRVEAWRKTEFPR